MRRTQFNRRAASKRWYRGTKADWARYLNAHKTDEPRKPCESFFGRVCRYHGYYLTRFEDRLFGMRRTATIGGGK